MPAIVMLINLKGGVAKTTNAAAISECLAAMGYRTLCIDADHQCMAGELLLGEERMLRCESARSTFHDLLLDAIDDNFLPEQFTRYIQTGGSNIGSGLENLDVMPCSVRIDDFQTNAAKARQGFKTTDEWTRLWANRRRQLQRWLSENYDFTIIDCPPSIPIQVRFLLPIAQWFIVPSVPDRLSVRGSVCLLERLRKIGVKLKVLGTLWSLYRQQNPMHRELVERGMKRLPPCDALPVPFRTVIPNAAAIAEATEPDRAPASFQAKYSPKFAKLFRDLCQEIVERTGVEKRPKTLPTKSAKPSRKKLTSK